MKMSIEAAMEIWKAGGGVAAVEWQEKAGWKRGCPVYRRRATPVYCLEYERRDLERLADDETRSGADRYWSMILANVTHRYPKVRKIIAVVDAASLRSSCEDAKIPVPQRNVDGSWNLGGVAASAAVWAESARKFTEAFGPRHEAEPRYVWQELAKRLASPAVMAS